MSRRGPRWGVGGVGALVLLVALLPGCGSAGDAQAAEAQAFLDAWEGGDLDAMVALVVDRDEEARAAYQALGTDLGLASVAADAGSPEVDGDTAVVPFDAALGLQGLGTWQYRGSLRLVRVDGEWRVDWSPAAIHPSLQEGERLVDTRVLPTRASVLAVDGRLLSVSDAGGARRRAGPAALVGAVEPASQDDVASAGLRLAVGDPVGVSALEARFDRQLAGRASGEVRRVAADGAVLEVLHSFPGDPPEVLETSIDLTVQAAAQAAADTTSQPSAIVAIDAPTGAVRAVANGGPEAGFDRALLGEYAPGSTFKVVTTMPVLENGIDVDSPVACPAEAVAGGRPYANSGFKDLGQVPFSEAFAQSCNTTFVLAAEALPPGALFDAAEVFGFNAGYDLGVTAIGGSFPQTESSEELTAASIGQGRVSASPLHMATVAAAAASGTWHPPWLAAELDAGEDAARPLTDEAAEALPALLREAVESGTGVAADIAGQDVSGKTGTAEFGDEDPPETHAWFIGFRGDLAFAVLVDGGGFGGDVAAPMARTFLEGVPVATADAGPGEGGSGTG